MSQYFVRCPHCSFPHAEDAAICPITGEDMQRRPRTPASDHEDVASPPTPSVHVSHPSVMPPPPGSLRMTAPPPPPMPAQPAAVSSPGLVGSVISGTYAIHSILGGGAMATIYVGEQIHNGRKVAVKVLPGHMVASNEAMKRFLKEARLAAGLSHPNICCIYDFGTLEDGRPFYAMELLEGESLAQRIARQGALRVLDAVEVVMQILAALRVAHQAGVVHRDIKPGNVFLHLRGDGRVMAKLLDFGVAKALGPSFDGSGDDTTQLTRTGFVMGTPYYLAPEQAMGYRDIDARVDLWAAGVVLYEALTARRPFTAPNFPGLVAKITSEHAPRLASLQANVPAQMQAVLDMALAKSPKDRYQKASHFLHDLQAIRMILMGG